MEIEPNPYDIVDGELLSSDGNLLFVDEETGTQYTFKYLMDKNLQYQEV